MGETRKFMNGFRQKPTYRAPCTYVWTERTIVRGDQTYPYDMRALPRQVSSTLAIKAKTQRRRLKFKF